MTDWNKRFMELACHVASWSKDRKRHVGAVIVDEDRRVISVGYNGIPQGCDDNKEERHLKPNKLMYFEHAERNSLYSAAKSGIRTKGCAMYVNWFPCSDCCRGIIQSGIKKLVCKEPNFNDDSWGLSFKASREMLEESGVEIVFVYDNLTQEEIDKMFMTSLGEQLDMLYSTSDNRVFIRYEEAKAHSEGKLDLNTNPLDDKTIKEWFPSFI